MAEASDVQGILYQNLMDAGCDRETVQRCMALSQSGKTSEQPEQLGRFPALG